MCVAPSNCTPSHLQSTLTWHISIGANSYWHGCRSCSPFGWYLYPPHLTTHNERQHPPDPPYQTLNPLIIYPPTHPTLTVTPLSTHSRSSFAVPFEEDRKDADVWYLDHNYLNTMDTMFRKVDAREYVVGFYSTGPKIRANDLQIDELMRKYCEHPVFVIIDVRADVVGVPVKGYAAVDTLSDDSQQTTLEFSHVDTIIDATESEEVGVEHLLRDINDPSVSTLAGTIKHKMTALRGLKESLEEMRDYLQKVRALLGVVFVVVFVEFGQCTLTGLSLCVYPFYLQCVDGTMTPNNTIMYNIQAVFNLLPNLNVDSLAKAFVEHSNDVHLVIYISSIVRSIVALHSLVRNKTKFGKDGEKKVVEKKEEEKKEEEPEKDKFGRVIKKEP